MNVTVDTLDIDIHDLLADAELNAKNDWEIDFVASFADRVRSYGNSTFISPRQLECLYRIAGLEV